MQLKGLAWSKTSDELTVHTKSGSKERPSLHPGLGLLRTAHSLPAEMQKLGRQQEADLASAPQDKADAADGDRAKLVSRPPRTGREE